MLSMKQRQLDQIILYAASASPQEVCGMLAGRDNIVLQIYPITNVAAEPQTAFKMEQREQIHAMLQIDEQHLELLAIYHSHPPGTPAWPSETDLAETTYPDVTSIILALDGHGKWTLGAFQLRDGLVSEVAVQVS
jgi:[CysO sulfur-carrier protein]-S-L-cysteine hydrolase